MEELREIVLNPVADQAETMWHLDLSKVWPVQELEGSGLQKIERFVQHRIKTVG
jgi:hypothetical protein